MTGKPENSTKVTWRGQEILSVVESLWSWSNEENSVSSSNSMESSSFMLSLLPSSMEKEWVDGLTCHVTFIL